MTLENAIKRSLLEHLAERGEVLDYLITTFKGRHYELAVILEHGFQDIDYDNLMNHFSDEEQSQSEIEKEEAVWIAKHT